MKQESNRREVAAKAASPRNASPLNSSRQHRSSGRIRPSSMSSWSRAILGTLLVLAGLATAVVTFMGRRLGAPELAGIWGVPLLGFVVPVMIPWVAPLAPPAFP